VIPSPFPSLPHCLSSSPSARTSTALAAVLSGGLRPSSPGTPPALPSAAHAFLGSPISPRLNALGTDAAAVEQAEAAAAEAAEEQEHRDLAVLAGERAANAAFERDSDYAGAEVGAQGADAVVRAGSMNSVG